ncbi:MAG: hypothetical protein FWG71_11020, partial [Synergistaceae bacterium]|nr:hypothetical protein [Synergistaceae bacterium]
MKQSRRFFWRAALLAALCLALCGAYPPREASAAAGPPMGDAREAYVKDSILAFFISYDGESTETLSRVISFDVKEPGANVGYNDAAVHSGTTFNTYYGTNSTGTPAALGKIRGSDGKLTYAIADYGSNGWGYITHGKVDLNGNVSSPRSWSLGQRSGFTEARATDLLMYDLNGDDYEDYIIAEIFYTGSGTSSRKEKWISIVNGEHVNSGKAYNDSIKSTQVVSTTYAATPYMKLGLADFTGSGKKQLVAAYAIFPNSGSGDRNAKGSYYFDVYDINPATFELTRVYTKELGGTDRRQDVLALAVGKYSGSGRDEVMVLSNKNTATSTVGDNEYRFSLIYFDKNAWGYKEVINDYGSSRNDYDGGFAQAF